MVGGKVTVLLCVIALIGCGCSVPILRQDLPVSSNPLGATIYADGEAVGQTPATVSLARNRDHLLTLVKEDYRQVDVAVTRQYQSDRVLMRAVQMGMNSGHFFHDVRMGLTRGFNAVSEQEASGEAYLLVPSVVQVELTPLAGVTSTVIEPSTDSSQADGTAFEDRSVGAEGPSAEARFTAGDVAKAGLVAESAAMADKAKPIQKTWETSSSSKSYVQPDGTTVTEHSRTTVGARVNAEVLPAILDALFK